MLIEKTQPTALLQKILNLCLESIFGKIYFCPVGTISQEDWQLWIA